MFVRNVCKEFFSLLRSTSPDMSRTMLIGIIFMNLVLLIKGFIHTIDTWTMSKTLLFMIPTLIIYIATSFFYFMYYKYYGTKTGILMRGISFLFVYILATSMTRFWIPWTACSIYLIIFLFSVKKMRVDVKSATKWIFWGFIISITLFIIVVMFANLPEREIYYRRALIFGFIYTSYLLTSFLYGIKKRKAAGNNENTLILYGMSQMTGYISIEFTPIFITWLPLPGFAGPVNILMITFEYIAMMATTPLYIDLTKKITGE
jgi:hypothetical protein